MKGVRMEISPGVLPENTDYRDTGCNLAPSCLNCPLPRCKYDYPQSQRLSVQLRQQRIMAAIDIEGLTVAEAAERFSMTRRAIWGIKARDRRDNERL